MMSQRSILLSVSLIILIAFSTISVALGQEIANSRPATPSALLKITGLDGKSVTFTPEEFASLPHKTVSVFNFHSKANERYSGVALTDLLAKVGVPVGEKIRGKLFLAGIIAEGTDRYSVLYALAEVDPSIHSGDVIVADSVDEHKLEKDGAFKMISTDEKRPARWVRNLASITVIEAKP